LKDTENELPAIIIGNKILGERLRSGEIWRAWLKLMQRKEEPLAFP
jgi:hypothetical protein